MTFGELTRTTVRSSPLCSSYLITYPACSFCRAWAHAFRSLVYPTTVKSTSILIPFPQSIYRPMPAFLKSTLLFDFPFYKFDGEGKDGVEALKEEEEKENKKRREDDGERGN